MKTYSLVSSLHEEIAQKDEYRSDWENFNTDECEIFVRTGGTESEFRALFEQPDGSLKIEGKAPLRLLTDGQSNSLAASMEILSYLRQKGFDGRIIHGSTSDTTPEPTDIVRPFDKKGILAGKRYGIVGKPSDWLISSRVDYEKAREVMGCTLIDIPISELLENIKTMSGTSREGLREVKPKFGRPISRESFGTALNVYDALKTILRQHALDGFTIRCFDLLSAIGNTACLALSRLNSEGYVATCEGDVPAMLSMAVSRELYGKSGFQVNLSKVEDDMLLFAHCTIPLDMVEDFSYDTHFESGIGVAIHGILPEGRSAKIIKIGSDLEHWIHEDITLVRNQYANKLCRTQIWVRQGSAALSSYMLRRPLGNHHVLIW
ncbi:MAG: hypothetical protein MJY89_03135 [Bacteroidales bacterium]|nr:hypothetical protein [Bacteroidales bacterium]